MIIIWRAGLTDDASISGLNDYLDNRVRQPVFQKKRTRLAMLCEPGEENGVGSRSWDLIRRKEKRFVYSCYFVDVAGAPLPSHKQVWATVHPGMWRHT